MTADADRALTRDHFDHVTRVTTRWSDNDMYGHLNNAVYYELFDSAINALADHGRRGGRDGLARARRRCRVGLSVLPRARVPAALDVAVRVERLGRSSITYTLGLFDAEATEIAALGHWVHVYIGRDSRGSVPMPQVVRDVLQQAVDQR